MATTIIQNKETKEIEQIVNNNIDLPELLTKDYTTIKHETIDETLNWLKENAVNWTNDFELVFMQKPQ